ncbi:hypothetical protein ACVW1C_002488 [Bradyrhizobium sp. USDA 4011]
MLASTHHQIMGQRTNEPRADVAAFAVYLIQIENLRLMP